MKKILSLMLMIASGNNLFSSPDEIKFLYFGEVAFKSSDELKNVFGKNIKDVYRFDLSSVPDLEALEVLLRKKMNIEEAHSFDFRVFDQGARMKAVNALNPGDVVDWKNLNLCPVGVPWVIVSLGAKDAKVDQLDQLEDDDEEQDFSDQA